MRRGLKALLVVVLLGLLPLRAVAAVTIGFCAAGHQQTAVAADAAHGHGTQHGQHEPKAPGDLNPGCSYCAEHCAGATFVAPSECSSVAVAGAGPIPFGGLFAAGFVPDHLERPPLAS